MITLYSGTPGSGKSYHACRTILELVRRPGRGVIANFPITLSDHVKVGSDVRLTYWDNSEFTPSRLVAYARLYHTMAVEGQTLLVIDEAQVIFNSRTFQNANRLDWIKFFSQHRKLGFDVLLISQNDRMIDKQIRMLIEIEVKHRKINNYGFGGVLISLFGRLTWFGALRFWYGGNKLLLDKELIRYEKRVADIYDTMRMFDDQDAALNPSEKDLELVRGSVTVSPPKRRIMKRLNPLPQKERTPGGGGIDQDVEKGLFNGGDPL